LLQLEFMQVVTLDEFNELLDLVQCHRHSQRRCPASGEAGRHYVQNRGTSVSH
jgi:hypothetical protein